MKVIGSIPDPPDTLGSEHIQFAEYPPLQISTGIPPCIWLFYISAEWWANHVSCAWRVFRLFLPDWYFPLAPQYVPLFWKTKVSHICNTVEHNVTIWLSIIQTHHALFSLSLSPLACVDQSTLRLRIPYSGIAHWLIMSFISEEILNKTLPSQCNWKCATKKGNSYKKLCQSSMFHSLVLCH